LLPVEVSRSYSQNKVLPFRSIGLRFDPEQAKKNDTRAECRPLVAVNERMIPAEIIQICCRDFGQIPIR
jgi:hypothetical protein